MRIEDIRDANLREWAKAYLEQKREEYREEKRSFEPVAEAVKGWLEQDWKAWRVIVELRARIKGTINKSTGEPWTRGEIEEQIGRRLARLSRVDHGGTSYAPSYTMGLEVAVLLDIIEGHYYRDLATPYGPGMLVLGDPLESLKHEGFEMRRGTDGYPELRLKPGFAWRTRERGGWEVVRGVDGPVPPPAEVLERAL